MYVKGRPLRGGRGLKPRAHLDAGTGVVSPPARGAWIETRMSCSPPSSKTSPPARGAWIETPLQ